MGIIYQIVLNTLIISAFYSILALSFNLIYSVTKFLNFSYTNSTLVSGYTTLYAFNFLEWPLILSILAGLLGGGTISYIQNKLVFLPLRKKNASPTALMIASLGLLIFIREIYTLIFSSQFQTLTRAAASELMFQFGLGAITVLQFLVLAVMTLIFLLLFLFSKFSSLGLIVRSIWYDQELAKILGVPIEKAISKIFIIAGFFAGIVGIFICLDTGLKPTLGFDLVLKGMGAALIGGLGNLYSALFCGLLLGCVENIGVWAISGDLKDSFSYVFIILALLYRNQYMGTQKWNT